MHNHDSAIQSRPCTLVLSWSQVIRLSGILQQGGERVSIFPTGVMLHEPKPHSGTGGYPTRAKRDESRATSPLPLLDRIRQSWQLV